MTMIDFEAEQRKAHESAERRRDREKHAREVRRRLEDKLEELRNDASDWLSSC